MRKAMVYVGGGLVAVLAMVILLRASDEPASAVPESKSGQAGNGQARNGQEIERSGESAGQALAATPAAGPAADDAAASTQVADTNTPFASAPGQGGGLFQADRHGQLVINEETGTAIESLLASRPPEELSAMKKELARTLPAKAAAQLNDLIDRYQSYQVAQRLAFPPSEAPPTEEDILIQLDGMHALRIEQFGPEVATALFGSEEKIARSMVELMKLEKDESLNDEEKAARAQVIRETLE